MFIIIWSYLHGTQVALPSEVALGVVLIHLDCPGFVVVVFFNLTNQEAEWPNEKSTKFVSRGLVFWHSSVTNNLSDREDFSSYLPIPQSCHEEGKKKYILQNRKQHAHLPRWQWYFIAVMKAARNNIVHKENVVIQKCLLSPSETRSGTWRTKENRIQGTHWRGSETGWITDTGTNTCSNEKHLNGCVYNVAWEHRRRGSPGKLTKVNRWHLSKDLKDGKDNI